MGVLGGIVPLILGILASIGAYELTIGELNKPGPGLWPFILSAMLVGCSLLLLVKDAHKEKYDKFTPKAKMVIYTIAALAIFIVIFKSLGMAPAVIALLLFQLRVVGAESWKISILVTAGMTVGVYVLFSMILKLPFPGFFS